MEQLTTENTQITAQYKEASAKAEQLSSEVEHLRKLLSENGISIPEDKKKL
jgi:methyl-accepting chemotaxis protein